MSVTNSILIIASLASASVFFHPKLRSAPWWRATVTPLASIIGSGFLVAGPILAHVAGSMAWAAMLGLCVLAYMFGAAIRHNIVHVEPVLRHGAPRFVASLERAAQLSLSLAYFVSVAYYIYLFSAFVLRFGDVTDPFVIKAVATVVIVALGMLGAVGGLKMLERLEVNAVGLKLCIITGLIAALAAGAVIMAANGAFAWRASAHEHGVGQWKILLGLVILVQGFETSRYLGEEYDAAMRVRTMRRAQWFSSAIYVIFVLLITSYFGGALREEGGETAIIDMLLPVGAAIAPMIIIAALASQLSAAVADMNGAGGLLAESSNRRLSVQAGNIATAGAAVAIIWVADIYEIIAYASKAFVFYYALQSLQAALSAYRRRCYGHAVFFAACLLLAVMIVIFAAPAKV